MEVGKYDYTNIPLSHGQKVGNLQEYVHSMYSFLISYGHLNKMLHFSDTRFLCLSIGVRII